MILVVTGGRTYTLVTPTNPICDADAEAADLIYHWLVLMASSGISLDQVAAQLEAREGQSGLEEKASRKAD